LQKKTTNVRMFYIKFLETQINLTYTISWKQKFPEIQMWKNHHWLCVAWRALVKPMKEYKLWFKAYTKYLSRDKHLRDSYSQQPESPEDSVIFFFEVPDMSATTQRLTNMDML